MSITSGSKPYNQNYPVGNINNSTKGFRDNFSTIKFAIENLQAAQSTTNSVLKLVTTVSPTTGAVSVDLQFQPTGFRIPQGRPANPTVGTVCHENGQLMYFDGNVWQTYIALVGNTLTLSDIVVTNKLTLNYAPSAPNDAASVQWVQNYIAGLPSGGTDPQILLRLDNLEAGLLAETDARALEDQNLRDLIDAQSLRMDGIDTAIVNTNDRIDTAIIDLNTRMDTVESNSQAVSDSFALLAQDVNNLTIQVNGFNQALDDAIALEKAQREAADIALQSSIDNIINILIPDVENLLNSETQARIAGDATLQQNIDDLNTSLTLDLQQQTGMLNAMQNELSSMTFTVNAANAAVTAFGVELDDLRDLLDTEKAERIAGDQQEAANRTAGINNEKNARIAAIATEKTEREAADAVLQAQIDDISSAPADIAALQAALATEVQDRQSGDATLQFHIDNEEAARIAADTTLQNNIDAEAAARGVAVTAVQDNIDAEAVARGAADTTLQNNIDALSAVYLNKNTGGTVEGPTIFEGNVTVQNASLTLENGNLYLPDTDLTLDANMPIWFRSIPNSHGVGDAGFIVFNENLPEYAWEVVTPTECGVLRIGSTNDSNGAAADSVAIEAAAHLYLNPGWAGDDLDNRTKSSGSKIIIGDAVDWTAHIDRDTGDITTKGAINATGDIIGLSDKSVKDNVTQITSALDKIEQLVGVIYNRNDIEGNPTQMGLIAQDAKPVVPEVVRDMGDGKLGVAYANLVALLIEGIKELREEVRSLKK